MPLSERENRVIHLAQSRRAALLDDLRLHVSIPTGWNHASGLDESRARFLERLAALGAITEFVPGDAQPEWLHGDAMGPPPYTSVSRSPRVRHSAGPRILIAGHLDTVHDPHGAFRGLNLATDGATATGPGCVDMKGGLVIAIAALEILAEIGEPIAWTVLLNSDEETGSYSSAAALRAEAARHDFGLALEPAMLDGGLVVERGGSAQFRIDTIGRSAHVGRDFASGISAVTALAQCIVKLSALSDLAKGIAVNVGPIRGGHATNVVPDSACLWGNVRFRDVNGLKHLLSKIDDISSDLSATLNGRAQVIVKHNVNRPAKPMTPQTERLALAARAVAEDLGQRLPFGSTGGVCDGNILQDAGLPTIDTLGVRGGGLHTPQEWIEVPSLVERCGLLALLMMRLHAGVGAR
ncbi:MAG: M20/M25/M40 family metallo-hydrolase [Phycisphaerae bacterium]|nr:M20/M25/M40 family metallo-hydrolase [Phycisphaerae bacterium]